MLQRSEEWFKIKDGRFSASDIVRLLGKEGLKRTNDSIDNYAFEKAVQVVYGREEEPEYLPEDLKRGIEQEPLAFDRFKSIKELDFMQVEECFFFPFGDHAGASPDGLVNKDAILEIKCPRRNKFFKYVANGAKEIDSKYIAQMQMQMLCTNSIRAHFFNYLIDNGKEYWYEIIIERDEVMIQLIKDRLKIATKIKLDYIEKLRNNIQC